MSTDPVLDAQRLHQMGRNQEALTLLRRVLQSSPKDGRAHYVAAAVFRDLGHKTEALDHAQTAASLLPGDAPLHYLLAQTQEGSGHIAAAIDSLRTSLRIAPNYPEAHHYLGLLLSDCGQKTAALEAFGAAVRFRPAYPRAWNNMGTLLRELGKASDAEAAFRHAIRLQPDYAMAHANLGMLLRDTGNKPGAIASLRRALSLQPNRADAVLALGNLLRSDGQLDEALKVFRSGLGLDRQNDARVHLALAFCQAERGDTELAVKGYQTATKLAPGSLRAALGEALTLAPVYLDRPSIASARERFSQGTETLRGRANEWSNKSPEEVLPALQWSNFYLAYHGLNDRPLQEEYSAFVHAVLAGVVPKWLGPIEGSADHFPRVRIGFLSSFFTDSTVGHYFKRWITELDRDRFEVSVYQLRPGRNPVADEIANRADRFHSLGGSAPQDIAQTIRAEALDVLVYPELGMDSTSFLLAAFRLARVQVAGWGHPVTSGHSSIDYYLTSGVMEPHGADVHYTERLVRLPGIGTSYPRPSLPKSASREELGLPGKGELLLLPQSLYKIHPDNDALVAEILARRPAARVVLFNGRHERITRCVRERMGRALESRGIRSADRLLFLDYVPREKYLQINLACDIMLDTLHWSGGNTSLDALACHLPIVTLPGEFMRGRQSAAMLDLAGIGELVAKDADQYAELVESVLAEPERRKYIAERLAKGVPKIFDDPRPLAAVADFFYAAGRGKLPIGEGGSSNACIKMVSNDSV